MSNKISNKNTSGETTTVIGDGNVIINGKSGIGEKETEIIFALNAVAKTSKDKNEAWLAREVIARIQENNTPKLKKFILDNIPPLISGTFAAAAGGMLVEFFKGILAQ